MFDLLFRSIAAVLCNSHYPGYLKGVSALRKCALKTALPPQGISKAKFGQVMNDPPECDPADLTICLQGWDWPPEPHTLLPMSCFVIHGMHWL